MDVKAYIASGILELYVSGNLSEKESREVYALSREHPEILEEIRAIEAAYLELGKAMAPTDADYAFAPVSRRLAARRSGPARIPWFTYAGWAAAAVLAVGFFWMYSERNQLQGDMRNLQADKQLLESQVEAAREALADSDSLMREIRARDIQVVPLAGQQVAPEAYAKVYWNRPQGELLIDALGLPEPPPGMVYQVWSLKLDPLTPTSLGLLEDFTADANRIFTLPNPNESEAFGITLEPAGGSESPTLEQLYTLGAV